MKCLLVVDVQNDFIPGGALAVPAGDEVIAPINKLMDHFDCVVATQDFHPKGHVSFASAHEGHEIGEILEVNEVAQMLWPDHCVEDSFGAELHELLDSDKIDFIVYKGTDLDVDSYSAFFDNKQGNSTGLSERLKEMGVTEVFVTGLALDYCVKFSALDALSEGFDVTLVRDASRAVDVAPGDGDKAVEEMLEAGAKVTTSAEILKRS